MGNAIEVPLQIGVIRFPIAGGQCLAEGVDRLRSALARTIPIRAVQEVRFKDRLQHEQHRHLDDPVFDRGYSQRPLPPVRLGNVHALHRLRLVGLGAQFLLQFLEELRRARPIDDVLAADAVHSGSAVVLEHQPPSRGQHVEPMHPVIQRVKPEFRFLLGLAAQLPPQLRDFPRQRDARLHLRLGRWLVRGVGRRFFRSGSFNQAGLLTSCGNTSSAGLLRSTDVTPLHRYYEPLRLPIEPAGGYLFPHAAAGPLAPRADCPTGSLRFLLSLSAPAARSHPGGPDRCVCSLLDGRWQASPLLEGWPSSTASRGRNRFTFVAADAFVFQSFRPPGYPAACPVDYMANEHLPRSIPFNELNSTDLT